MTDARSVTSPSDGVRVPLTSSDGPPEPGELKIKERRSWKTWQLLTAVLVAVIFGMWINGDTGGGASSTSTSGASSGSHTLPPPSASSAGSPAGGSAGTTTTAAGGSSVTTTTAAGGSTTTTAAGGSTTTTAAGGSTTATTAPPTAASGPARVLLTSPQLQGNWTSTPFTITAASWNIGWAFRCAPAPAAGPSFQVLVTKAGSPASGTPAISETGASGQSVTAQSSLGSQTLVVQAPASCTWIVKVTGS